MVVTLFFDTYALYEILRGNSAYEPYKKNVAVITTKLNLVELHFGLLKLHGKQAAQKYFELFEPYIVDVDNDSIFKANELKLKHKKKYLSYVDCIGYILALKNDCKFLTGDKEFKDFDNVEFVK